MPSQLNKVTKSISKKRQAKIGKSASLSALHENSRDAKRIRRAAARDEKVGRSERERRARDEKFLTRMAFFHSLISLPTTTSSLLASSPLTPTPTIVPPTTPSSDPLLATAPTFTAPQLHALIALFLARHGPLLAEHVAARRPGRPKTPAHLALEAEMAEERDEYASGLWMVDLRDARTVHEFRGWRGEWGALGGYAFVRVAEGGAVRGSSFPPGGKGE